MPFVNKISENRTFMMNGTMTSSLFVLLLFSVGVTSSLLGSKRCTWGPSYWCSHISKAKECGAFKHCMDAVWSKQIIEQTNPTADCTLCQMLVNETKGMLKNNATEKAIIDFFEKACNFLPSDELKNMCNDVVKNNADYLIKLLSSDLSAMKVCATLGICQGFQDRRHGEETTEVSTKAPPPADKVCKDCQAFFGDIKNMVQDNDTAAQIEATLKQLVCSQLGSVEGLCDFVVDEYVPMLLSYLATEVDPGVTCRVIGFCNQTDMYKAMRVRIQIRTVMKKLNKNKIGGTEECNMCKSVVTEVRNIERDPTNQKKVVEFIQQRLCSTLGSLAGQCQTVVEDYGPMLLELIANELDPASVCIFVGFCRTTTPVKAVTSLSRPVQTMPALPILPAKQAAKVHAGELCDVCKLAVKELDDMLTKNATETEIENALKLVCSRLPAQFSQECNDIVVQYAPAILDLLSQELDPNTVCTTLRLCTAKKVTVTKVPTKVSKMKAGELCALCELAMKELDQVLSQNATKEEIENAIKGICDRLPGSLKDQCDDFVNQYGPAVLDLLVSDLDPKTVCTKLGLCTGKMNSVSSPQRKLKLDAINSLKVKASPQCIVCEYVMSEIDKMLGENRSKAAIENALDQVCNVLPSTISAECKNFVQTYAPVIINLLIQEVSPKTVCTTLGLCTSVKSPVKHQPLVKQSKLAIAPLSQMPIPGHLPVLATGQSCLVCETLVNYLVEMLGENRTVEAVEEALEKVCGLLPSEFKTECDGLVQQYGPAIAQLLSQLVNPKKICTELGLCTAMSQRMKPDSVPIKDLKENFLKQMKDTTLRFHKSKKSSPQKAKTEKSYSEKCSYGPAYWCRNVQTAVKCGALEHCKNHVWKNQYMTYISK